MIFMDYNHFPMKIYTIFLLAALFLLVHTQYNHNIPPKCIPRNDPQGYNRRGYNSGYYYSGRYYSGSVMYCDELEALEKVMTVVTGIFVALFIILLTIGGLIFWRVMVRVKKTEKIRNKMLMKKQLFASQQGLNLYEASSYQTLHV